MRGSERGKERGPEELETRWERVLRGVARPEEAERVREEVSDSGREAEFEAQAEIASHMRRFAVRYEAPPDFRQIFVELAERALRENRTRRWHTWRAAFAGALAASVVLVAGLWGPRWFTEVTDPYQSVAEEVRAAYLRALVRPEPVATKNPRLEGVLTWFRTRLRYTPKVNFRGNAEFPLEGGSIATVSGEKVPTIMYRSEGRLIMVVVLPLKEDAAWARIPPEEKPELRTEENNPPTTLWRRGDSVYALVGYAPPEKLKKLTTALAVRSR